MKKVYLKDIVQGKNFETTFMIKKILNRQGNGISAYIGDKTGDIKANIKDDGKLLDVGNVVSVKGTFSEPHKYENVKREFSFELSDFVPTVKRPIQDIMNEIEQISKEEFLSREAKELDQYFFGNDEFLNKFKKGIGGVSQHHGYLGGLAEHTLGVMYLARVLAYRYDARYKEIAILAAKLHDIGKLEELSFDGPFSYTLKGEMEGHIVLGVQMLEKAFMDKPNFYSEDFKERIKACIVQHHGKLEYGSPREPKTEEAFIVHYADYVDAVFNKIESIKDDINKSEWTPYDKRIDSKLYV